MHKTRIWVILLALLIALSVPCAYAQNVDDGSDPYVATIYNERNGLPTGEANAILQTSDGYIWIGSYGGLIRYDGSSFRNYSTEGKLPSASVRSLFEDSEGTLWIGTNDAGVFYMQNDEIIPVENSIENSFMIIRDFVEGYSNTIYVASNSGMAMIHGGKLTPCRGDRINSEAVYSVGVDSFGRVWGALNSGMLAVVEDNEVLQIFSSDEFFGEGMELSCAASDANGNIYLGSTANEILRLTFTGDALDDSSITVEHVDTENVSYHNKIIAATDGSMIVCANYGMCVLGADGSKLYFDESDYAAGVNDAIIDYEGNIWFASTSSGTVKYTQGCFQTPEADGLMDGVAINAVVKQLDGYYVATDSGVMAFDADWHPVENGFTDVYGTVRVRSLLADSTGGVWVASYDPNASAGRYDPATDTMTTFGPEDGLPSSRVRSLLEMSDGRVVLGTQEGFSVVKDGKIVQTIGVNEGLEAASTLCLLESYDGNILAGSDGQGIYEFDGENVVNHGFNEGLQEGAVLRMLADPEGNGYFVTAGDSLYYWDGSSYQRMTNLQKGMGGIFDLYLRDGKLWILQNAGIRSVDRAALLAGESEIPTQYSFAHGLPGSINANTWNHLDENGTLYLSTRNGVSIFNFRDVSGSLPKGIIGSVNVDGEAIANPTELTLSASTSRVTFDTAALSFTDITPIGMSYWLEGFDEDKTVLIGEKKGSISYTNLDGGEYTFYLSIFNPSDPDDHVDYALPIVKEKKLLEQPIALAVLGLGALLVIAGIVALIVHLRLRSIRKRQREYRVIIEQSLQTLAEIIDAKDPYTIGHSKRVAQYAGEIARRMGKSEEEQENIRYIALLHDIGKVSIPLSLLNKPEPLSDEERATMRSHTTVGGDVLSKFTALPGIADGARYHHERYDGTGYPDGKSGEAIPEVARIIRIADACDVMRSGRLHRGGMPLEDIIVEFRRKSGTKFDPKIVPVILDMLKEGFTPVE